MPQQPFPTDPPIPSTSAGTRGLRRRLLRAETLEERILFAALTEWPLGFGTPVLPETEIEASRPHAALSAASDGIDITIGPFLPAEFEGPVSLSESIDSAGMIWDAAELTTGDYVTVWLAPLSTQIEVVSQRFRDGLPLGIPQRWATYDSVSSTEPMGLAVLGLAHGDYVIAWSRPDGIYLQQVTADDVALGDIVHVADPNSAGEQLDLLQAIDGDVVVAWSNFARTSILTQRLGSGLIPQGGIVTLVTASSLRSVSSPKLLAHPTHPYALRWTEGPDYVPGATVWDPFGDRFGTTTPDYAHFVQPFDAAGTPLESRVSIGQNSTGIPPAVGVSPSGELGTVEMGTVAGETIITLNLRNKLGEIDESLELGRSRFAGFTAPQFTMLDDGGFVVAYGVPYPDGPLILAQEFNRSATPIGPVRQLNAGDDVGFPPEIRTLALGDFEYAVVWPHQLLEDPTPTLVSRRSRLGTTPVEFLVPDSLLTQFGDAEVVVRLSGMPSELEFSAGERFTDLYWYVPLSELAGVTAIGDEPLAATVWTLDFIDIQTKSLLDTDRAWATTPQDDVVAPLADTYAYRGGAGVDTFVVSGERGNYVLDSMDAETVVVYDLTGRALWELNDFERVRFDDIALPVDFLLAANKGESVGAFLGDEDLALSVDAGSGVLANQPAGHSQTVFVVQNPSSGSLTLQSDGSFTYQPVADWDGTDSFEFDTRSMTFAGGAPTNGDGGVIVADAQFSAPTMSFATLPNELVDDRSYTVTMQVLEVTGPSSFELAFASGASLIPDELTSAHVTAGVTGQLTYHFVKQPEHDGFTFVIDSQTAFEGQLRIRDFRVLDDVSGEILVNSTLPDFLPRLGKIDVHAVADVPELLLEASYGTTLDPVAVMIAAALADEDGSEQLEVSLAGIPVGTTVSDGSYRAVSLGPDHAIDISDWNHEGLTLTLPGEFAGAFELSALATSREVSNGDEATSFSVLSVAPDTPPIALPPPRQAPPTQPPVVVIDGPTLPDLPTDGPPIGPLPPDELPPAPDSIVDNPPGSILAQINAHAPTTPPQIGSQTGWNGGIWDGGIGNGTGAAGNVLHPPTGQMPNRGNFVPGGQPAGPQGPVPGESAPSEPEGPSDDPSGNESAPQAEGGAGDDTGKDLAQDGAKLAPPLADATGGADVTQPPPESLAAILTPGDEHRGEETLPAPNVAKPGETGHDRSLVDSGSLANAPADSRHAAEAAPAPAETQTYIVNGNARVPAIFAAETLWREMDEVTRDVAAATPAANMVVGSAVIVASGFSAAQVLWLLRGSVLVTKLMSSMPMWIAFDPLPVLDAATAKRSKKLRPLRSESLADIASSH